MMCSVTLSTKGYDPFIDFLKGFCIICVILNHSMSESLIRQTAYYFWGVSAVPLFILIQIFHGYKKGIDCCHVNYYKIWHRVLQPYLLCQLVIFMFLCINYRLATPDSITQLALNMVKSGGYGPGAYYPWIYAEIAIILPFTTILFRIRNMASCLVFILLSQVIETLCVLLHLPDIAYRLLFFRYSFLSYLGYLLATKGFHITWKTITLAIICLAVSTYIVYEKPDTYPLFYPFVNPVTHWFCYIYIAFLLLPLLRYVYQLLPMNKLKGILLKIGQYSYEIFLFQMAYFILFDTALRSFLLQFLDNHLLVIFETALPVVVCTLPILFYKSLRSKS